MPCESPAEARQTRKPEFGADVLDRDIGLDQQAPGLLESSSQEILLKRPARRLAEQVAKMRRAQANSVGDFVVREVLAEVLVDEAERSANLPVGGSERLAHQGIEDIVDGPLGDLDDLIEVLRAIQPTGGFELDAVEFSAASDFESACGHNRDEEERLASGFVEVAGLLKSGGQLADRPPERADVSEPNRTPQGRQRDPFARRVEWAARSRVTQRLRFETTNAADEPESRNTTFSTCRDPPRSISKLSTRGGRSSNSPFPRVCTSTPSPGLLSHGARSNASR